MTNKTLVERVIAWLDGGCSSWNVPSSDIRKMATRIEALEAALRKIEGQAVCVAMPTTEDEMRDWLQNILQTTQQALEGTGNG